MRSKGKEVSAVIIAAMLGSGCDVWPFGPSKSVAGVWRAPDCSMGSSAYELSLTQDGDRISGVACVTYFGFGSTVREMAVSGRYPNVRFTDNLGREFAGKFEADRDQIAGNLGSSPLRFNRTDGDDDVRGP